MGEPKDPYCVASGDGVVHMGAENNYMAHCHGSFGRTQLKFLPADALVTCFWCLVEAPGQGDGLTWFEWGKK